MAIFLTDQSRVVVQGMTGSEGMKHTTRMLASGTRIVGGVNPRKAGEQVDIEGTAIPVFGTVAEAMTATGADVSVVFVPPAFTKAAVIEAVDAGMPLIVVITEGVPGARHRRVPRVRRGAGQPDHRAQLPRPDQPRQVQRRHHPGRPSPGPGRSAWCRSRAR